MTISAQGPTGAEFLSLDDGAAAPVSGVNEFRLRYNAGTGSGQISVNGGAYENIPGLTDVSTGNEIWVDSVNGNDGTGASGSFVLSFATLAAALAVAGSGDSVIVRPGTYAESGLSVPTGVALIGESGPGVTFVTGAAPTGTRITVSAGAFLDGFTVTVPTDAVPAVSCVHAAGVASINFVTFVGAGGSGIGLLLNNTGKIICSEIRMGAGTGCDAMVEATAGILAMDACHMPGGIGAIAVGIRLSGGARGQIIHPNMGSPTITTGIQVSDAKLIVIGSNLFNMTNAIRVSANTADVKVTSGLLEASSFNLLVDAGLTGVGGILRMTVQMDPLFSIPSTWIDSDHAWTFFTDASDAVSDTSYQLWGGNWVVGHPEKGSSSATGEGTSYSDGNVVISTDNTASAVSDGGGFVDITIAARSKSGSTFSFQGVVAGHAIMWTTARVDGAGVTLKHWGLEMDQVAGAVLGGGSFIFEVQSAANTWVEVGVMSTAFDEGYVYANDVFLRGPSVEVSRMGINSSTTWPETTINGTLGHWMRARVASTVTTAPVFERLRILPSYASINAQGQMAAQGLAQWAAELFGTGNTWGEIAGGGAADANIPVGSGGVPTGWTQKIKKGLLNSPNDAVSFQFQIPDINTAFPLFFDLTYSLVGADPITTAADVILSVLTLGVGGVAIADSAGGVVPVARAFTAAEGLTSKPAITQLVSAATGNVVDKQQLMRFGPFDVSNLYQGDAVIIRLELDADGTPNQDLVLWTLTVSGVGFNSGGTL